MKDFFISYTRVDENKATWIAETLEKEGYTTIIQAWDFLPGSNFVLEMQKGLSICDRVIAVLSESYCASLFANPEWAIAFANDPMGQKRKLIPVRVEKFNPQGLLKTVVYIDLAELLEKDSPHLENEAKEKLLNGIIEKRIRKSNMFSYEKGENVEGFDFVIHTNGIEPKEYLNTTKIEMRKWLFENIELPVRVTIDDDQITLLKEQKREYEDKELQGMSLAEDEETVYSEIIKKLGFAKRNKELKELAIKYLLSDIKMFGYIGIKTILDLQKVINSIIKLKITGNRNHNEGKRWLEIWSQNTGLSCWYFKAEVSEDDLYQTCGGNTTFHVRGEVFDLGVSIVKEILPYYYFFLAEETIIYKQISYEERSNQEVFDIFKYSFGMA